jgi:SsrA-binding protein
MAKKRRSDSRAIAVNRKARHTYFIDETLEAGIMLTGTEVKGLRAGGASIGESFANAQGGEIFLLNAHIPEYKAGTRNHEPRRPRKLLLHKREMAKLITEVRQNGRTLVPLKLYFNDRGRVKVQLALARGKKAYDKRHSQKDRDWKRDKARLMREKG